jgi:hypothetical protein
VGWIGMVPKLAPLKWGESPTAAALPGAIT